jgi:cyclic pyranopterin phosphate synthase
MWPSPIIDPKHKILRYPELLLQFQIEERVWPVNVEVDPSNACNLKCGHCDFAYIHGPEKLEPRIAERVFAELAGKGTRAITFTGGGEPTVSPHFEYIVGMAEAAGLDLGLYTNGLNGNTLEEVLNLFTWVYISLDACNRSTYEHVKGVDAYNRVVANIQSMVACRTRPGPAIGVGFLLNGDNWGSVLPMARLAEQLGADYCQFRPVVGLDDYSWVPNALALLGIVEGPKVYVSRARFEELHRNLGRTYHECRASELVPCIGASGEVWVCPNTRGLRSLGNLHVATFAEIWSKRPAQLVGDDCRVQCRNHALNETLEYVCGKGGHDSFV